MAAPGNYDVTAKTYIRWDDRIESLYGSEDQMFSKYVGDFQGQTWNVNHKLRSENLLIGIWKNDITNPASFWKVSQIDYENLTIEWTAPVDGRVVLYSIRPFVGVAMVHDQVTASKKWTITHNFGTEDVIYTCWVNGLMAVPLSAQTIDINTIEITFPSSISGKCVLILADPEQNPSLHIDWNNIYNLPKDGFPPSAHTHDASDISGIGDVSSFDGHTIDDFLLKEQLGKTVAPLVMASITDTQPRLPEQYLPNPIPFWVADESGEIQVTQLFVISKDPHPLFIQKVPSARKAYLDIKPVLRQILLMGNVTDNPSIPSNKVEVSSDYLIRLKVGAGLVAKAEDKNTISIANQQGTAKVFTRITFADADVWNIVDPIFETMGNYSLSFYETQVTNTISNGESKHITGQTEITQPFQIIGEDMMVMDKTNGNGDIITDKVIEEDTHFVYADRLLTNSLSGYPFVGPSDVDAVYWDATKRQYILRSKDTTGYTYRTFDTVTNTITPLISVPYLNIPEHTSIIGSIIYSLQPLTSGGFELYRDNVTSMPSWSWKLTGSFPTETMPVVSGNGMLRFRVSGAHLVILNTSINSLAVYDINSGVKLHEKALPKQAKDFDMWPDEYISISFVGEDSLWVSTKPIWDYSYDFRQSIDFNMGDTNCFALRDDDKGALGMTGATSIWYSNLSKQNQTPLYAYGETILWVKSPFAWKVNPFWSQVLTIDWESYDISAYDDVRIGFFPGREATMPDTLYRWNGTGFDPFSASDLPTLGQPLSILSSMQLMANDVLSYAIYIKKGIDNVLNYGNIQHNFKVTYRGTDAMYPIPIGGPVNNTLDHILVKCGVGALEITNTLGRDLNAVRLVVVPAV